MDCATSGFLNRSPETTSHEVEDAVKSLADLICQTPEYQNYTRGLQLVNADPEVNRLTILLRKKQRGLEPGGLSFEALQAQIEALSAVQAYWMAEARMKSLFQMIEELIGVEAGVDFAANALPRACG